MNLTYTVAIYIRLSREDAFKEESLSVTNQKKVLESYVKENNYNLYNIYIDDGFTGTNFERPAFKKMINDIENGKINMVITKDLSRLGRDYIVTGEYIEKFFPMHNIRYVALLDGIDTVVDNSNNDIAPFKAVINDMYSRDNSKKIRTAIKTMQKQGKWVGGCVPFGYQKDPLDKNHLVPNEEEAKIVKQIFNYANNGLTYYQISTKLTEDKIRTPSMIRGTNKIGKISIQGIWSPKTIKNILSNELYLGDMIQNKNNRISYKIRKNIKVSKENWLIVPNTHEPLIDRDTFFKIQQILSNSKIRTSKKNYRALDGLLYCHECSHKITICSPNKRGYTYTVCNYYRTHSKTHLCTSHSFNYDKLEKIIFLKIKQIFKVYLKKDIIKKNLLDYLKKNNKSKNSLDIIKTIQNTILNKKNQLDKMYLDKLDGKITSDMYERINTKLNIDIVNLEKEKDNLLTNENNLKEKEKKYNKIISDFLNLETIERLIIIHLINKIEIHKDKTIDIYFNFKKLS